MVSSDLILENRTAAAKLNLKLLQQLHLVKGDSPRSMSGGRKPQQLMGKSWQPTKQGFSEVLEVATKQLELQLSCNLLDLCRREKHKVFLFCRDLFAEEFKWKKIMDREQHSRTDCSPTNPVLPSYAVVLH